MIYPTGQTWAVSPTQTLTYTLDAMERPTGLTGTWSDSRGPTTYASGATYNPANQPLHDGTAIRAYNSLLQMTSITGPGMSMTYNYSSTSNNGQIASSVDGVTGETITYTYDALKRLLEADGLNWKEKYVYDGFGNLTQMNPSGTVTGVPSMNLSIAVDANNVPNNRIAGESDNNGNQSAGFVGTYLFYDAANRVSEVQSYSKPYYYGYDADNRRVYSGDANGNDTIYFYGAEGRKLATYSVGLTKTGQPEIVLTQTSENVYFLGKLVWAENNPVSTDRLGSVRSGGPAGLGYQAQYPYGTEYATTANDREKYATYTRDSITGLDYAMNRYYSSQWAGSCRQTRTGVA
jgi:YD repeat-containing protein